MAYNSTSTSQSTAVATVDSSTGMSLIGQFDFDRAVANVTPEQKKRYGELTRDIRTDNPRSIQSYGQDVNKIIAKQADDLLDRAKANKTTDVVVLTNQLLAEIGDIEQPTVEPEGFKGWLKSLPIIGGLVRDVEKAGIKRNTIGHNVGEISKKIESLKVVAMSDNASLESMADNTATYIQEIRERIVALMLLKKDVDAEVAELEAAEVCDLDVLMSKRNAQTALSKRITDMQTTEYVLKQNLNQIAAMEGNNDAIIDKADMTIGHIIPIWKQQLALGTMMDDQQAAAEVTRRMEDAANRMLVANAKALNQNSIEIARQGEETMFRFETLEQSTNAFIDTVKQMRNIHENGERQRVEMQEKLVSLGQKLQEALVG